MYIVHRVALAAIALTLLSCTHASPEAAAIRPPITLAVQRTDDAQSARRQILAHLESDMLVYSVTVDSLQLITPAYDGEYVFAANTTTRRGPDGPPLAWKRVVGSLQLGPKPKFHVWKERAIAPTPPSPPSNQVKVEPTGLPGGAPRMQNGAPNSR